MPGLPVSPPCAQHLPIFFPTWTVFYLCSVLSNTPPLHLGRPQLFYRNSKHPSSCGPTCLTRHFCTERGKSTLSIVPSDCSRGKRTARRIVSSTLSRPKSSPYDATFVCLVASAPPSGPEPGQTISRGLLSPFKRTVEKLTSPGFRCRKGQFRLCSPVWPNWRVFLQSSPSSIDSVALLLAAATSLRYPTEINLLSCSRLETRHLDPHQNNLPATSVPLMSR